MPQSSLYYTDLQLPTLNGDGTSYGTVLNTYIQGLETKLKNLSDRVNAAGVGSSSTLAQINRDIAQTNTNTSGILPDPYSGNYSTVSTWPAYNTELTALGISPPETASEIETFFSSGDFTTFANFLDGKLDALDIIVTQAESDLSSALEDTCATKTILDARTAAQSSGEKQLVQLSSSIFFLDYTKVPTAIGGGVDESEFESTSSYWGSFLQDLIDDGTLTTSFQSFWGNRAPSSDLTSNTAVGNTAVRFSTNSAGEDRGSTITGSTTADVQAKYTGSSTVDSTTRLVLRMTQVNNTENNFNRQIGDTSAFNFVKYRVRYPYPALNCSNPSPPYFS